ncbi:integrase [Bradyrhizobium sp. AZCC 1610]|uniref:tyrosine-type recombinase/integrase n=1 Tax=Bradyrhizobium sp. AZCC 1610 TaxID=3117020 RepID=UPI002FF2F757
MKKRLTDVFLKTVKTPAGAQRTEYHDSEVPGLILRVTDKGGKTFSFHYKIVGTKKNVRVTIGPYPEVSLEDARERAREYRTSRRNGEDPRVEKKAKITITQQVANLTFDTVCDEYIEKYSKPNISSWKNDVQLLRRPRAEFGRRPIEALTDDDFANFLEEMAEDTPVQANRTQSKLYQLFKWAKKPGRKYVKVNPLEDLDHFGKEEARERVLEDDEIVTLWHGLYDPDLPAEEPVREALRLILCTMVRPGQAAGALRTELKNFGKDDPQWHIPKIRVKKRRDIIVPLNDVAVGIIKRSLKDEGQIPVFPSPYGGFKEIEKRVERQEEPAPILRNSLSQALTGRPEHRMGIREFLKLEHFTPHDLRRTAATLARRAGAPRDHVKATLDHVEDDVTDIYDKYNMLPEKTAVENVLGNELKRILGAKL